MENKLLWKQITEMIVKSIIVFSIAKICYVLFDWIDGLMSPVSFMNMMQGGSPEIGTMAILSYICSAAVVVGYIMFFVYVKQFRDIQEAEADKKSVNSVFVAYILLLVAVVVDCIPMVGWIAWLVFIIIGYVKLFGGYKGLRDSQTFNVEAKGGAALLYSATVWALVADLVDMLLPYVGGVLSLIFVIVSFVKTLKGWKIISAANVAEPIVIEETK